MNGLIWNYNDKVYDFDSESPHWKLMMSPRWPKMHNEHVVEFLKPYSINECTKKSALKTLNNF